MIITVAICDIIIKWMNKEGELVYGENWEKMTNSEFESIWYGIHTHNICG